MKVVWSKRAGHAFMEQIVWYEANRNNMFVVSFRKNVSASIATLVSMPTIGVLIKKTENKEYRSFVIHKRCTMYYWYNEKEFHIVNLRFSV